MEGRFEVTVMDRKTGKLAEYGGMKAQVQTSFGILCAMAGADEDGSAFVHFLEDAHGKKKAAFILHGLSLIPTLGEGEEA